ncbi:MAG: glycosyltransferase [Chloroflexota bacterium]
MSTGPDAREARRSPSILVVVGYYPPAYLAGGPTRSVPRIVERLSDTFQFRVVTRASDFGTSEPLRGITADRWLDRGRARCRYLSARARRFGGLGRAIRDTPHDVLYLNSIFDFEFSLLPLLLRRLRLLPRRGLVIAPRGELDPSALALKGRRKQLYLTLARRFGLFAEAAWHAATPAESEAIIRAVGPSDTPHVARDIPARGTPREAPLAKEAGALRLISLSRISPMKNLDFALHVLRLVQGTVTFTVRGPIEDRAYWASCMRLAAELPANVTLRYDGPVEPDAVADALVAHDLFFLPSRAESFGHAIVEALLAGLPVLISDQTPWHGLEARQAGWDLPLSDGGAFATVIDRAVAMSPEAFAGWSRGAQAMGAEIADDPALDEAYRALFRRAVGRGLAD